MAKKSTATYDNLINTNERYFRIDNVRIAGVKHYSSENCIDITRNLLNEITNEDIKIERSHKDGRIIHEKDGRKIHEKDRHIFVKLSFYQDKMDVMKNIKQALRGKSVYVIDHLCR